MSDEKLNAALFWRAATVVRDGGDIPDEGQFQANCLQGPDGGFAPGPGAFDQHFDFFQPVPHGLARSILRDHLGRISGTFA